MPANGSVADAKRRNRRQQVQGVNNRERNFTHAKVARACHGIPLNFSVFFYSRGSALDPSNQSRSSSFSFSQQEEPNNETQNNRSRGSRFDKSPRIPAARSDWQ